MAMANLLLKPTLPSITHPKFSTKSDSGRRSPPKPSFLLPPPSHRRPSVHACALVKEHKGFAEDLKWPAADMTALSFWDDTAKSYEKFQCQWAKEGPVGETKDETRSANTKTRKSKKRWTKIYTFMVGASLCVVVAVFSFALPKQVALRQTVVPYSDFIGGIRDGSVTRVQFVENSRLIYYDAKPSNDEDAETRQSEPGQIELLKLFTPRWRHYTRNVGDDKQQIIRILRDKGITYGADPELLSDKMKTVAWVMLQTTPYWVMVGISGYQLYMQQGLGKMKKRKQSKKLSVTFDDVEGVDSAKAELLEIVLCINEDSKYMKLGAKLPRGVLLAGPPGTGKTLLARAVAGEAGVSFFSISASELVEVFVGTGAARVREIFRQARKNSPSIIFIDEIDAVGEQRGRTLNCERDQTLNQLLTEMDGFDKDESVVVIAATNRPETLDSALMRPGRFSRKVLVGEPDEDGRRKIFALYMRDVPMQEDKETICELVASRTKGLVGADLENIANESVMLAGRRGGDFVTSDDVLKAVERATTKIYDDDNTTKTKSPYPFGPTAVGGGAQYRGPAMGFGFPN